MRAICAPGAVEACCLVEGRPAEGSGRAPPTLRRAHVRQGFGRGRGAPSPRRRRGRPRVPHECVSIGRLRAWRVEQILGLSIVQHQPPAPGHPDWDGQADARRPRPWLAPGMWHPRIPLSSRMSRAARAASPVRDPPGAALTWVRRCLAVWEGRERPFQGASGRQPRRLAHGTVTDPL
jgi:hypothetical protein